MSPNGIEPQVRVVAGCLFEVSLPESTEQPWVWAPLKAGIVFGLVVVANTEPRNVYVGNPPRATGRDSFETFAVESD